MRIVIRMCTETTLTGGLAWLGRIKPKTLTCFLIPAAHDKVNHLLPVQRVFVLHDAERGQAPVDRVQTQVRSEVVHEVILALRDTDTSVDCQSSVWHPYLAQILNVLDVQRYMKLKVRSHLLRVDARRAQAARLLCRREACIPSCPICTYVTRGREGV